MSTQVFYVYVHKRLDTGAVFYVGKGFARRAYSRQGRNPHWRYIVAKHGFEAVIVKAGLSEQCAFSLEKIIIGSVGFKNLTNVTTGGEGFSGGRHTEESRRKLSASLRGKKNTPQAIAASRAACAGKPLSAEHRAKLSASHMGQKAWNTGKPHSEVTKEKLRQHNLGKSVTKETREKIRQAHLGHKIGDHAKSCLIKRTTDWTEYRFEHPEHGTYVGIRKDFIQRFDLSAPKVCNLISGKRPIHKGWTLSHTPQTGEPHAG